MRRALADQVTAGFGTSVVTVLAEQLEHRRTPARLLSVSRASPEVRGSLTRQAAA
jgi:hypothetical protein